MGCRLFGFWTGVAVLGSERVGAATNIVGSSEQRHLGYESSIRTLTARRWQPCQRGKEAVENESSYATQRSFHFHQVEPALHP